MGINALNTIEKTYSAYGTQALQAEDLTSEQSIFEASSYTQSGIETVAQKENEDVDLRQEFETTKEEQGLIGKAWDGLKNLFHMKNGSDNIEDALNKYEAGEISEDEAKEALGKYQDGQKMCVDVVGDIASGIISVGAAALAPFTGGASLLVAAGAGAAVKTAIKATDAAVGGRDYETKDFLYDLTTGSINGLMGPISNGVGGAVGTGVAKACGLEALETTAKTTGKGFLSRLLAKQGTEFVAKEGAKTGLKTFLAKSAAYGSSMAIDGALSGGTDGFSRALGEGRIEHIGKDTLTSAFGGLVASPVIGGSSRFIFKGASKLNSKIFHNGTDAIKDEAADKAARSAAGSISDSANDVIYSKLSNEAQEQIKVLQELVQTNPESRAKDILKAIKKAAQENKTEKLSRISGAIDVLNNNDATIKELEDVSKALAKELASGTFTKETVDELNEALGAAGAKVKYNRKTGVYASKNQYGNISARSKSPKSIFSKIKNKIFGLEADLPTNIESAQKLIGDAQGTRLVIKNSSSSKAIQKAAQEELGSKSDAKLFMKYLKNNAKDLSSEQLSTFKQLETKILNDVNEEQTKNFVDSFADAIKSGKLTVTEINNYAGENGLPYLSESRVDQIRQAYEKWFDKTLEDTKNTTVGRYSIVTNKEGIDCLYDTKTKSTLKPALKVVSKSTSKDAVKSNGYSATQFNLINKFGQNEELQFRGKELNILAEFEHIVYDAKKGKDTVSAPIYDKIKNVLSKVQNNDTLKNQYDDYFREIFYTARKRELGINAKMPKITDFSELVKGLSEDELQTISLEGVEKLHKTVLKLKKAGKL